MVTGPVCKGSGTGRRGRLRERAGLGCWDARSIALLGQGANGGARGPGRSARHGGVSDWSGASREGERASHRGATSIDWLKASSAF